MTPLGRFILATLCGLVLAGLVHLATVLAIPYLAAGDALARSRATLANDTSVLVHAAAVGGPPIRPRHRRRRPRAGCRRRIRRWRSASAPTTSTTARCDHRRDRPLLETIALHGRNGAYYAITDQAAVRGTVELVIMTRRQFDEALASADEDERNRDMRIVAPSRQGFVSVRVLAALRASRPGQRGRPLVSPAPSTGRREIRIRTIHVPDFVSRARAVKP